MRHTGHQLTRAPTRNYGAEGGPWCAVCQAWTEVDGDREAGNVCVRCGRPGVVMKAPPTKARGMAATVRWQGKTLSPAEAHALFDQMRKATE